MTVNAKEVVAGLNERFEAKMQVEDKATALRHAQLRSSGSSQTVMFSQRGNGFMREARVTIGAGRGNNWQAAMPSEPPPPELRRSGSAVMVNS